MEELERWMQRQLEERTVEPNSGLGEAIKHMKKHWAELTLFLRVPGAPMDNNICERALKKVILHRKNALFFKTLNGARVGDIYMSLIHTAKRTEKSPGNTSWRCYATRRTSRRLVSFRQACVKHASLVSTQAGLSARARGGAAHHGSPRLRQAALCWTHSSAPASRRRCPWSVHVSMCPCVHVSRARQPGPTRRGTQVARPWRNASLFPKREEARALLTPPCFSRPRGVSMFLGSSTASTRREPPRRSPRGVAAPRGIPRAFLR